MSRTTNTSQKQSTGFQSFVWTVIQAATMPDDTVRVTPRHSTQAAETTLDTISAIIGGNNPRVYSPAEPDTTNNKTKDDLSLLQRAWYGAQAGFATGLVVVGPETIKVKLQKDKKATLRKLLTERKTYIDIIKNMPQFATLFGCVCALEFSINDKVKKEHGLLAGITASGMTGALFLSSADHLIYRGEQGQKTFNAIKDIVKNNGIRSMPTGFLPYFFRESAFMLGITLGPKLADSVSAIVPNISEEVANDIGTWTLLLGSTLATQPFDTSAREMQKHLHETGERISMRTAMSTLRERGLTQGLFRGGLPRLALAPVGGALASGLYKRLKKLHTLKQDTESAEPTDDNNSSPAP